MSQGISLRRQCLVRGEKIVLAGAYGYSNAWREHRLSPKRLPHRLDVQDHVTFALLQQMNWEKFKLDDSVNAYLAILRSGDLPQNPVTFRHLLDSYLRLPATSSLSSGATTLLSLSGNIFAVPPAPESALTTVIYSNLAYTLVAYLVKSFRGAVPKVHPGEYPRPSRDEGYGLRAQARDGGKAAIPTSLNRAGICTRRLDKSEVWPAVSSMEL